MGCLNIIDEGIGKITDDDMRDLVRTATTTGNHMLHLLNDILDISKNKHLSQETARDKVIYQTLAFEAIDGMRSLATSTQIQLKYSIEPNEDKILIIADRTKVVQIVSNLVNNAIKFTSQGWIDVKLRLLDTLGSVFEEMETDLREHSGVVFTMKSGEMLTSIGQIKDRTSTCLCNPDEKWLTVSVADTGCGMQPSELAEMFAPYTQSSGGASRTFQGTGLGLFICVSLCHQLSGFIAVGSTPGTGTTFYIGIPVELASHGDQSSLSSGAGFDDETPEHILMHGPILIADDNVVNVKVLQRALKTELKKAGLEIDIVTAPGGDEAIALYKEVRPSLCIIDYHMPGTDGIAVIKAVRKYENDEGFEPTYMLSYTADVTEVAHTALIGAGSDDILSKPTPKGFLSSLVRRLVVDAAEESER